MPSSSSALVSQRDRSLKFKVSDLASDHRSSRLTAVRCGNAFCSCFLLMFACLLASCAQQPESPAPVAPAATSASAETSSEPASAPEQPTASPPGESTADVSEAFEYHNPLSDEQKAAGWLSLLDGHSLFGWESTSSEIDWRFEDGNLTAQNGPIGFLVTTMPFTNYELVCEYRMEAGGNSGLFLRSEFPPGDIATQCIEVNIADEHPDGYTTASLVNRQRVEPAVVRNEDWNELHITLNGNDVAVRHNGAEVLTYTADGNVSETGRVALQKHTGKIEFRKLLLKPLLSQNLFNGTDLAGWREVPGSQSEFRVADGAIHLKNGPGYIETEETWQDFIFQAQAISHAPELNSGFFFRAMPGTEQDPANGYEYQIHNGFEGDRTQPNNAGTGAIFRRINARYVVANDHEWFTATIIAYGPRVSTWVDGYLVVDWVDERKPDPNPRRGQRLSGGHLSIQGHDPTTDLSFRNLMVEEYPATSSSNPVE